MANEQFSLPANLPTHSMKVIALSWHPATTTEIISGGYKRFSEIAKRTPSPIVILDRYPSIYSNLSAGVVQIKEYGRYLDPKFLKRLHPYIYDFVQRVITVILLFVSLLKERPKIIYVPDSELSHLTLAAIAYKWLFRTKVILANLNVNTIPLELPLNVFLHRFADKIITISSDLKKELAKTKIFSTDVNGVGFDKPKINKHLPKKFDAIFIGRQIPQKGIFDLINIWNELINIEKKKISLVLVGNVPTYIRVEIDKRIEKFGLKSYMTRLEDVPENQKIELLQSSKIMVFPSHQEGWGIAPMEALSLGLPVVAYDLPVYDESVGKSPAFITVEEGNTKMFAVAVNRTLDSLAKYSRFAKMWRPALTWEKVATREWQLILGE